MADPYWVSPTGAAAWVDAQSAAPLVGAACASIATANSNVAAGDTVKLRSGTYSAGIDPQDSGGDGNVILFEAHTAETPSFEGGITAIEIDSQSYIKVDGITADTVTRFFMITDLAHYNEITNCTFNIASQYSCGYIGGWSAASNGCTHNWVHGNTITKAGSVSSCADNGSCLRIGNDGTDPSNNNTIEDNVFSYGAHDIIDVSGKYNVIRNNVFHNEEAYFANPGGCDNDPESGFFGNRNILVQQYGTSANSGYTLIEKNRIGHAGTPPDDDGAMGIELSSEYNILRFNYFYANGASGISFKDSRADNNRLYNNTVYHNGYGDISIYGDLWKSGIHINCSATGNEVLNNIVYNNSTGDYKVNGACSLNDAMTVNNNFHDNMEGDPDFANDDISDPTSEVLPDLRLNIGSSAISAGTYLTLANGADTDSITLVVDDASFFQDGSWGSSLATLGADYIAIGTVGNTIQISSINYGTNTITLAGVMTWDDDDPVWIYKDSDGDVVLNGLAPNYGADQGTGEGTTTTTTTTTGAPPQAGPFVMILK